MMQFSKIFPDASQFINMEKKKKMGQLYCITVCMCVCVCVNNIFQYFLLPGLKSKKKETKIV